MGLMELNNRLQDPLCAPWLSGIFPTDTQRNTRFSINFFTSIGLGGLTDNMRAQLKEMQRQLLLARNAVRSLLNRCLRG
jgi:pre-mRNA-splicing factor CWC22